jgi:hypothetical protein
MTRGARRPEQLAALEQGRRRITVAVGRILASSSCLEHGYGVSLDALMKEDEMQVAGRN